MIESIQIKNFKSVVDLSLELGTFNVLIGENGCGKSNILEAVAFGAAASADKLDFEFLANRGIRLANPKFMFSAFAELKKEKIINLNFKANDDEFSFELINDSQKDKKWVNNSGGFTIEEAQGIIKQAIADLKNFDEVEQEQIIDLKKQLDSLGAKIKLVSKKSLNIISDIVLSNYIIFSLEQSSLREYEKANRIYPLGIKGEGLLQYLKELAMDDKNKDTLMAIKQNLMLLDWYEDFDLPDNLMRNEYALKIKDKYLDENLQYFDQRSTNEGFLFLLFYSTLFISKDTPTFFAIDNIDTSFNPKLCMQLTKNLAALAKQYNKQVIVTTHNPAILDGLNLKDDSQRLFVVSRNIDGHTRAERISFNENRTMKLSEVWTKGFIGGLPSNF